MLNIYINMHTIAVNFVLSGVRIDLWYVERFCSKMRFQCLPFSTWYFINLVYDVKALVGIINPGLLFSLTIYGTLLFHLYSRPKHLLITLLQHSHRISGTVSWEIYFLFKTQISLCHLIRVFAYMKNKWFFENLSPGVLYM